ncbi:16S rRNA (guanine(527)-N(7))-methyltransferase RsmG [Uliginosibacterium sp. H3]|uniref:Ribosomal RNA small subunit methyltransferase G n=1 Tax=Uliginosibacterium silvisoli TaxID=3114758 RepID=A0ABU6K0V0_9RHOO|nr:16S rRNA (guanine(527)-N(7))-methyltransferase RsmG [Uliginosibacterium sp. H3]
MTSAQRLAQHIAALNLDLDQVARDKLLAYVALILKWNKVYNLTAIRDEMQAIDLHIADSLTLVPHVSEDRIADIGAGAGLPGIVLAICKPELQVELVDTVDKKCVFMRQAAGTLGLKNVSVHHVRVEKWQPSAPFPAISSRAFAELVDFVSWTDHLLAPGGRWLAMKGVYPSDEIARLPAGVRVSESIPLKVPGMDVERHLIILQKHS